MNNHIPTISAATRSTIRKHIIESERRVEWPYLDIKGNVTIGVGFKTDTEDDFAKLDLQVFKDGKWVEAKDGEKREAFFQHLQRAEGHVERIHTDNKGIPTLGVGTALAVRGRDGRFRRA